VVDCRAWVDGVGGNVSGASRRRFERWGDGVGVAELSRLARTVRAWEAEILAWHTTDCGGRWQIHQTARLRSRTPRLKA
jgi:hypothetical protein